jgi:hypothetical protein
MIARPHRTEGRAEPALAGYRYVLISGLSGRRLPISSLNEIGALRRGARKGRLLLNLRFSHEFEGVLIVHDRVLSYTLH